ncbi:MAG: deoxyhypusine synthase family protein [Phycisphaerae bacterium]|nr:deoxyhypusine synthase family protein [Phycisphaerae bacterium]
MTDVSSFLQHHFRHFNAAALMDAAKAYRQFAADGGQMFLALAGAMSTGEIGLSLAEMIRQKKVHAISCTGANLEEDLFNLVAHEHYERIPGYRDLNAHDEQALFDRHLNRVTDTCIPEHEAMRRIEHKVLELWLAADAKGQRDFPHQFLYQLILDGGIESDYQIDPRDSWLVAAAEADLPMFVPGWEDSTLGNIYAAHVVAGDIRNPHTVKTGIEYMIDLAEWYVRVTQKQELSHIARSIRDVDNLPDVPAIMSQQEVGAASGTPVGFFQIGGGIAGDFPICVVPMIHQDLRIACPVWAYFCQISDSTTSYGSYSGAVPNEKITWGKLGVDTPKFMIESDATIVAPLVFAYVLGW